MNARLQAASSDVHYDPEVPGGRTRPDGVEIKWEWTLLDLVPPPFALCVYDGLLETGKPFDAPFELHADNLTLLDIVQS
jgi:hypothetical protein